MAAMKLLIGSLRGQQCFSSLVLINDLLIQMYCSYHKLNNIPALCSLWFPPNIPTKLFIELRQLQIKRNTENNDHMRNFLVASRSYDFSINHTNKGHTMYFNCSLIITFNSIRRLTMLHIKEIMQLNPHNIRETSKLRQIRCTQWMNCNQNRKGIFIQNSTTQKWGILKLSTSSSISNNQKKMLSKIG